MNEIINLRRHVLSSSSLSSSWLNHEIDSKYDIHTEIKHLQSFLLQRKRQVFLRILYIPTAMYALQPKSTNTPGKQRQRARADGKQRRDHIIEYIQNLNILGQQQEEKEKGILFFPNSLSFSLFCFFIVKRLPSSSSSLSRCIIHTSYYIRFR